MSNFVERLPYFAFIALLILGFLTCPYLHHTNRLVQLSNDNYAVERCRSFVNMYCDRYDETPNRALAFEAWQRWEAYDHPPEVVRQLLP